MHLDSFSKSEIDAKREGDLDDEAGDAGDDAGDDAVSRPLKGTATPVG